MQDAREYLKLAEAIAKAPIIPPCMNTDPEIWFPVMEKDQSQARTAKKLCAVCPVKAECLTYAIKMNETDGIWGGLTLRERRRLGQGLRSLRPRSQQGHPEQPQSQI
jgi:hypothetical protein